MNIEHYNIIDTLGYQIEGFLDLIMCSDKDCIAIESIKTAAEMSLTMFTELLAEVDKIRLEEKAFEEKAENTISAICDSYCKYPCADIQGEDFYDYMDEPAECKDCPLNNLLK